MIFDIVFTSCVFALFGYIVHEIALDHPIFSAITYVILAVSFFLIAASGNEFRAVASTQKQRRRGKTEKARDVKIYKKGAMNNHSFGNKE